MEQVVGPRFSCGECGRIFTWKPAIAGKKAKCACGASLIVPLDAPEVGKPTTPAASPAAAPPKKAGANANGASKIAAKISPNIAPKISPKISSGPGDKVAAAAQREAPRVRAATPGAESLEYRRAAKPAEAPRPDRVDPYTGELTTDPFRDYIAPAILLAMGFASIILYAIREVGTGPIIRLAIPAALGVTLAVTIVKTLVLILAAVPLAALCDVNVGLLRTAIFKFAATSFFGDVAILWLIVAMQSAGMIPKKNDGGAEAWLIYLVVLALIYFICFGYLFRLSAGDIKFASLMALVSRLCNFFLALIAIAVMGSLAADRAQQAAANVAAIRSQPTTSPGAPLPVQLGQPGATALDDMISHRIATNQSHIQEGNAWCRTGAADDADKKLISDMYGAGAVKIYMDGFTMYAQLPGDSAKRKACLEVASAFRRDNGITGGTAANLNYQYVVIDLFGERLKGWHRHDN
jgi:hypothetical protein